MCGIAGFISPQYPPELRQSAVERMCESMRHRGPDDAGVYSSETATLGVRRLAIFDPANGHQPMGTEDGRLQIVFNGAIYNFRELRAELESAGITFRTACDTEVLLAAYAHWGEPMLNRLRGMFAFAIWDAQERALFIARDPFGIKPLYYAHAGKTLLFASEITALVSSGAVEARLDPAALNAALSYLAVPAPRTIYQGMRSLRPGECATFRDDQLMVRAYWTFLDATNADVAVCRTRRKFQAELRERLEDSIRAHSLADVPVGAFLSGGLDSTAIVALMQGAGGNQVKTFSLGFDETAYSETAAAEASARHFGTEHQTYVVTGERVAADIETILAAFDQPTGDAINTYYIGQIAHEGGVTAALSGLGGDELFGGYPWFETTPRLAHWLPWWRRLPSPLRDSLLERLQHGSTKRQKLADFLRHARNFHELAALQRRNFSEAARRNLLNGDVNYAPHDELAFLPSELVDAEPFQIVSAWEMRTYMADVLLRDSDVMSMRHSLELRVPFVDRPLVEWLWNQRIEYKFTPGQPKSALARAVHDLLPKGVAKRKKRGFTLPIEKWMRGALRPFLEETFSLGSITRSGLFNGAGVQARWQNFITGSDPREWSRVWTLAVAISFVNRRYKPQTPSP